MGQPDALGCAFEVTLDKAWARGFAVEIRVNRWTPGQQILVDYGDVKVVINRMWAATARQLPGENAYIFTLGPHTDERNGFGFNGLTSVLGPMPTVTCVSWPPPPAPKYEPPPPLPPRPPPPPSPPVMPPPPVSELAPKPPTKASAVSSSCGSVALDWEPSMAREGYPVIGYQITATRADHSAAPYVVEVEDTKLELTGLLSGTRYAVTIRAKAAIGYGGPSEPLLLSTQPATTEPQQPADPPTLKITTDDDCGGIDLTIPPLRPGCDGDQSYKLLASTGGDWYTIREDLVSESVQLTALDPHTAYQFRLVAVNAVGESRPGHPSRPLVTDAAHSFMGKGPQVWATSSASFQLKWPVSACRPHMEWDVVYAMREVGTKQRQWRLAEGNPAPADGSFEVSTLRCSTGCAFKIRPIGLKGWDQWSEASVELVSPPLPPMPAGASRIELAFGTASVALASASANPDTSAFGSAILADVAKVLSVDEGRLRLVEVRAAGRFVILDILSASLSATDRRRPKALAMELAKLAASRPLPLKPSVGTGMISAFLLAPDGSAIAFRPSSDGTVTALKVVILASAVLGALFFLIYVVRGVRTGSAHDDVEKHSSSTRFSSKGAERRRARQSKKRKSKRHSYEGVADSLSTDGDSEDAMP